MRNVRFRAGYLSSVVLLAACSGQMAGQNALWPTGNATSPVSQAVRAAANADVGALAAAVAFAFNLKVEIDDLHADTPPDFTNVTGACRNGRKVFVPDRAGDKNSLEILQYVDTACTKLVTDIVRSYVPISKSSERVTLTISTYVPGAKKPDGVRAVKTTFSNAVFGKYGYPVVSNGFVRQNVNTASDGAGRRLFTYADEVILGPSSGGNAQICADVAGYANERIAGSAGVIGATGILAGGHSAEGKSAILSSAIYQGTVSTAKTLKIVSGKQNASCPITVPAYRLSAGKNLGTSAGQYGITFSKEEMTEFSALAVLDSYKINVDADPALSPRDPNYVKGFVRYGSSTVARFNADEFGDGTYTTKSGKTFSVVAWVPIAQ